MDSLLIWVLFFVAISFLFSRRRRPQQRQQLLQYRRIPGEKIRVLDNNAKWKPLWLEEVPAGNRKRIVLGVTFPEPPEKQALESTLWRLASRLQERTLAHAVVIEIYNHENTKTRAGEGDASLLFAPDGKGWTGSETLIAEINANDQPARALALGEVQQAIYSATAE